jgi:hypothetical protein
LTPPATHLLCDRARSWAAQAPDGELSELERTLLRAHLAACGSCSRFAADVAEIATTLRKASFEPLSRPVAIPTWRRRLALARLGTVGAAAAVALMAVGIASRGQLVNSDRKPAQLPRVAGFSDDQAELQLLHSERRRATAQAFPARDAKHFGNRPA